MSDLSEKIIKQIEADKIKPYSKWHFTGIRFIIWAIFAISILIGSLGAAVSIFLIRNAEWDLYGHFGHSFSEFTLLILPWFWFVFIGLFTMLAFYYYRKTGKGYRMNTAKVVLLSISLSVALGAILNLTSVPEKVETVFDNTMPWYSKMHQHRHQMWMNPDKGFLAGSIVESLEQAVILLKDLNGKDWYIDISNSKWRGRLGPVNGTKIKLTGTLLKASDGQNKFKALEIRPWHGKGLGRMDGKRRGGMHRDRRGRKGH